MAPKEEILQSQGELLPVGTLLTACGRQHTSRSRPRGRGAGMPGAQGSVPCPTWHWLQSRLSVPLLPSRPSLLRPSRAMALQDT